MYRIPALKNAGGHRADDWNLAEPLQTCSLLVERRGDQLVLDFLTDGGSKLFCQSIVDCSADSGQPLQHWLEQVVDSSRYFTLKITGQGGREALIGFGFRDRDQATDLRESMQHYETAMRREKEAAEAIQKAPKYTIPKLAEGEKIHINTGSSSSSSSSSKPKKEKPAAGSGRKVVPLLLKKPPPSPETAARQNLAVLVEGKNGNNSSEAGSTAVNIVQKMSVDLGNVELEDHDAGGSEDGSDGAVHDGNEEEWAHEFDTK